jgi:hypothetical protein
MRTVMTWPLVAGVAVCVLFLAACSDSQHDATKASSQRGTGPYQSAAPTYSAGALAWPAPPDPLKRAVAAGLRPEVKESLTFHVHAHLDVFVDGKPITVPAGIGINIDDPGVRRFTDTPDGSVAYGGITKCRAPCISPLHTHDTTGILHTESATPVPNTLGQLFIEWGVRLNRSCVRQYCKPTPISFYVNGTAFTLDPRAIELTDHEEIAVVIGTPPPHIPATADFSQV